MSLIKSFICCAVFITACTNPLASSQQATSGAAVAENAAPDFHVEISVFAHAYAALEIPDLALAYRDNLKNLGDAANLQNQKTVLARWRGPLDSFDASKLTICERIDLAKARHLVARGLERADIGLRYLEAARGDVSEDGLASVALGDEWYEHYLKNWLGAEVSPDEIFAFGESQVAHAQIRFHALQTVIGFDGNGAGLADFLTSDKFIVSEGPEIEQGFLTAQKIVRANIRSQFYEDHGTSLAAIRKADSEQMIAVPGYYRRAEETFYYNVLDGKYDLRDRDWLFLHEATPGHHFQLLIHEHKNKCNTVLSSARFSSFLEGWAAYVETIGKELGLYQSPEYELAAIEWDMVRSARVLLDVGLNYYGWTDEKALEVWRQSIQGKDDITMREIARMRRWPAQVITYKFGADVFLRSKKSMADRQGADFDVRRFHELALRYGDMPLGAFEALVAEQSLN